MFPIVEKTRTVSRQIVGVLGLISLLCFPLGCGSTFERAAHRELGEQGYQDVTVSELERANSAFSFTGNRNGQSCSGEIDVQREMGEMIATITSRCE